MEYKKSEAVRVRITHKQKAEIKQLCHELDCTISQLLRKLIDDAIDDANRGIWID